ncbi:helix-turn-helix domain-containing protein [Alkalicoccobacillus gibsonii]|uniref:helix-turn-helix domain-containing protein n=1 Tax=Alkalicoccobacillus gibsonii TaxID=79881 RepID=UPI003F7BC23F
MEFGPIIKYYRLKSGITQAELADGICSIPHLSKIENNAYSVNKETAAMLMERLGLDINDEVERYGVLSEQLEEFSDAIYYFEINKADIIKQKVESEEDYYNRTNLVNLYHIYLSRYYFQRNKPEIGSEHIYIIEKNRSNLTATENLLFQNLIGVQLTAQEKIKESIEHFLRLKSTSNHFSLQELSYHLALSYTKLGHNEKAIPYAQEALRLFKERNNYIRIIHVEMVLAINYDNMSLYEEAKFTYKNILRNSKLLGETNIYYKSLHNYGLLLENTNEDNKAKNCLEECIEYFSDGSEEQFLSLVSYVEILLKTQSNENLINDCLTKLELYNKTHESKPYKLLTKKLALSLNKNEKYFSFLEKEFITHFTKIERFSYIKPVLLELSKWYTERGEHELANTTYQQYISLK